MNHLTRTNTKISLILGLIILFNSCDAVKRVGENQLLLTNNKVIVDGEETTDGGVMSQLLQKPNNALPIVKIPLGLHIYNLADPKPDSTFTQWLHKKPERENRLVRFYSKKQVDRLGVSYRGFNKWLENSGKSPVIIQNNKTKKSLERIKLWYKKRGWFNTTGDYSITIDSSKKKRAEVTYNVRRLQPYLIDSIKEEISSRIVDSLFQSSKKSSFIVEGKQYAAQDFNNERDRLTILFRNSGLYTFDQDYVEFEADTVKTDKKANITYILSDKKITKGDSTYYEPFEIHKTNEVRIVTDYSYANRNRIYSDSATYNGYKLYSYDKLKFKPKAITDAIAIAPLGVFKDINRTLTYNQISDLRIFKYPNISYKKDPKDATGNGLISTILLSPRKNATLGIDFDTYTSIVQEIGIGFSTSLIIRNIFRRAEILEISVGGSVGSSQDNSENESFFNTSDIGGNIKLSFPRILSPLTTKRWIPKYMSPSTSLNIGINTQNNIGLDRQNFNGGLNYQWKPSSSRTNRLEVLNIQYVNNLNPENYYNVYKSSYERLNEIAISGGYQFNNPDFQELEIPTETESFINTVASNNNNLNLSEDEVNDVNSIDEREKRLTENNLIFSTNFTWIKDTREGVFDNSFSRLRLKLESAGSLLAAFASPLGLNLNTENNYEVLNVAFSQYAKLEIGYFKHWEFSDGNVFAMRAFGGIAVPFGNSSSIPFTRSYFAGGPNDNRGWRAYDLGPGSSGSREDFNEANLKIALNAEYRFTISGGFKGAFFVDAGNIWNVLDNIEDDSSRFSSLEDLAEIAVASGFGLRYDFGFFVIRFDVGFKTYNPGLLKGSRWFKEYNFDNAVYNIGINYPF